VTVAENLAAVRTRIADAAARAGRDADGVTLVVVTKSVGVDAIEDALDAGAHDLGENRAQELVPKAEQLGDRPRWHFIGRLQRNKVRAVAPYVALWQSVDRVELAEAIASRAPGASVLVQVNVAGEAQKGGCPPGAVRALVERGTDLGLVVEGCMTVPPATGDPAPHFVALRRLVDDLGLRTCSMGMSGDFEAAVAAGATMVRVGTAIFGRRPPAAAPQR
jgi:pyridoxal phosphate enzyme (YggS family)